MGMLVSDPSRRAAWVRIHDFTLPPLLAAWSQSLVDVRFRAANMNPRRFEDPILVLQGKLPGHDVWAIRASAAASIALNRGSSRTGSRSASPCTQFTTSARH